MLQEGALLDQTIFDSFGLEAFPEAFSVEQLPVKPGHQEEMSMLDFECVLLLSPLFRLALILRLFAGVTRRRRSPGLPRVCCAVFLFSHAHHALSLSRPQCRIKRRSPRRMTMPSTSPLPWRLFRPQPTTHPSPRALPGRLRRPLSRRVRPDVHTLGEGVVSHWKQPSRFFSFLSCRSPT